MNANVHDDYVYGDSDFLAARDKTIHDFRSSEKDTKRKIIEKMLTLRHNMKYNKHLLSVYMRAKELFDTMVDEHRMQIHHLDEIYQHLNLMIRENLSEQRNKRANTMMHELVKDKKRIGLLLKKMRASFDKLMNIDTVIGVTIDQINELTFMDDDAAEDDDDGDEDDSEDDDGGEDEDDSEAEDEDDSDEDDSDEDDSDEDDSDSEAEDDDEDDSDSDEDDSDEDDSEAEDEDDSEPEESENNKSVIYLF